MKKWILILMMPESQNLYVLAPHDKGLKLIPVKRGEPQALRGVFGFDSEAEAEKWMRETASLSDQGRRLMEAVKPFQMDELQ